MVRDDLRNIAIIAHVDHGKTTLVDGMLKQSGTFRENQQVATCVMDSGDLERERGITILAKNTSIHYNGVKINVVDTPGHADFSGEVERVLKMVNGVVLLVDAAEGPMPQTRFVVEKALALDLKIIIVVNKMDRPDARLSEVGDEVLELLLSLDATDEQLMSPILYCSGKNATATKDYNVPGTDLKPLFDTIIEYIPAPEGDADGELQLLVSAIDYNDYVGRIGIGRIERGSVDMAKEVIVCDYHSGISPYKSKIVNLFQIEGLKRVPVEKANVGDIVCFSGIEKITIGNTICSPSKIDPVPFVKIGEPTIEMNFCVNDSPFAGKEGKYVTSRHLRERLFKETLKDVSLRVYQTDSADTFKVCGRGEMHLSILIETMRREGYEFGVGTPKVIFKEIDGEKCEPMERLYIDVPNDSVGAVIERMGVRKGTLVTMNPSGDRMKMEFIVPSRGLFGFKNEFLTDTKGEGVMNQLFDGYAPYKGAISRRFTGSLVAYETGEAATYGLFNAQERGQLFITPQTMVYEGMVVGVSPKNEDIRVNVCKRKHVTNMRAAGSDEALRLNSPRKMSLEEALEFLNEDEMLEVTPQNIRIRKTILSGEKRLKMAYGKNV
ncbi:MAG: translational GTPase TypA [Clostridia bacterium]|jgi:GTP-binding protein|nr:translational GTPase TypA [Clostridia bacterium]